MKYDFSPDIAKKVGVEEAILFSNIQWWCEKNKADRSEKHFKEDRYWTYSSERAWSELFPFWTAKQISRMITNLEKEGLIISGNFGGNDRTKWFSPLDRTGQCIKPNGLLHKTERVNDIIYTDNNPDNNPDIKENAIIVSQENYEELFSIKMEPGITGLSEKLIEFLEFRKAKKKPILPESKNAFLRQLVKLSGGDEKIAIEILEQSIANGWQGIFEAKTSTSSQQKKGTAKA